MTTNLEEKVTHLEIAVKEAQQRIEMLAALLSRYQFADPRFLDLPITVLDRLDKLERGDAQHFAPRDAAR